ncbi:pentapeptide repeat-containing protein [Spirosoma sp. RP8]|uniref:Pentapeptide repeat-containing protein n=1 Tax=Spirosoma liriopis TaxID=2937440 RepID=A0ABT0HH26_9BACT|nr:pentapeptide repeat-containing protein [Spirosoma liriopis]MCK8491472.1 pentapeptide repeat-containing protein [Spirosoma liriopis]
MKKLVTSTFLFLIALAPTLAQTTVDARDIIAKINRKEAVSYQNATITGDLDLTNLANRKEVREGSWKGESREYLSVVEAPISFKNCVFKGKFLAYRTDASEERRVISISNTVYNADFTEAVTVQNCTFEDDATFKYSNFGQRALFTDNTFREIALFKYAKFHNDADFSGSSFRGYADFKYANFNESSAFQKVAFDNYADFKYTKFDERVNFQQARFSRMADFKYTHLPRGTNFDDARFEGGTDFKYTTLDGRKFSPSRR